MTPEGRSPDGSSPVGLSIVIPLYRDEDALAAIFERCEPILSGAVGGGELVLVDDGGLDRATPRAVAMAADYPHRVVIVRLGRNFGQHPAVFAGLEYSSGELVATLDSDLQYPPEDIPMLAAQISDDFPVASGARTDRRDPMMRRFITRRLTNWLNARTGTELIDFGSMFRVYRRDVVEMMLTLTERHRYVPAVVAWLGVPIKEVPISHEARGAQGSRYRLSTLFDLLLDLVTGYSVFPLRLMTGLGLLASAAGFIGTIFFAIYRVTTGGGISGLVSAFALVFALLGVQLLLLALVGEYVGRIYSEAKGRPYYIVRDVHRNAVPAREGVALPPSAA
jgi:undecaprenyl-phosphate 4-deoxy-4-formamido-L-arabinose transferase